MWHIFLIKWGGGGGGGGASFEYKYVGDTGGKIVKTVHSLQEAREGQSLHIGIILQIITIRVVKPFIYI